VRFEAQSIDHVEVFVRDIPAAVRWYGEVLGLAEMRRWDPEPVMIGAGGTMLALFQASAGAKPGGEEGAPPLRWHRVAWRTDRAGFEAAQKHLTSLGIPFRGPVDHGGPLSIYFRDPDGHPLEITVPA
jgi:catechol 2,3-dioxygenase-like lactoylglutathione lyase family enzyme